MLFRSGQDLLKDYNKSFFVCLFVVFLLQSGFGKCFLLEGGVSPLAPIANLMLLQTGATDSDGI